MSKYQGVALSKELCEQIDHDIKNSSFTSRADFVKYSVRKELERLSRSKT